MSASTESSSAVVRRFRDPLDAGDPEAAFTGGVSTVEEMSATRVVDHIADESAGG